MRAKIVDNLMDEIEGFFGKVEGHRTDPEFIALCERIQGKEVDLVFSGDSAFEKNDNNYWLPDCCWKAV